MANSNIGPVYVVILSYPYEGYTLRGIYSWESDACARADAIAADHTYGTVSVHRVVTDTDIDSSWDFKSKMQIYRKVLGRDKEDDE